MEVVKQNVRVSMDRKVLIELPHTAIPDQTAEVIVLFENTMPGKDKLVEMEGRDVGPFISGRS